MPSTTARRRRTRRDHLRQRGTAGVHRADSAPNWTRATSELTRFRVTSSGRVIRGATQREFLRIPAPPPTTRGGRTATPATTPATSSGRCSTASRSTWPTTPKAVMPQRDSGKQLLRTAFTRDPGRSGRGRRVAAVGRHQADALRLVILDAPRPLARTCRDHTADPPHPAGSTATSWRADSAPAPASHRSSSRSSFSGDRVVTGTRRVWRRRPARWSTGFPHNRPTARCGRRPARRHRAGISSVPAVSAALQSERRIRLGALTSRPRCGRACPRRMALIHPWSRETLRWASHWVITRARRGVPVQCGGHSRRCRPGAPPGPCASAMPRRSSPAVAGRAAPADR